MNSDCKIPDQKNYRLHKDLYKRGWLDACEELRRQGHDAKADNITGWLKLRWLEFEQRSDYADLVRGHNGE